MLIWIVLACHRAPSAPPTLGELSALQDEERAGERLMEAPQGLNRLDSPQAPHETAVIAVHGYKSEGSEWVAPLSAMAGWGDELYFYRWDWNQCPNDAVAELDRAIDALVAAQPEIRSLMVVGHSYGGLVSAMYGQTQTSGKPTRLELIAAPLAGVEQLKYLCEGQGLSAAGPQDGTTWRQWRTVFEADGAFRDMDADPQLIELPGLTVVKLPAEWEGGRLGHNRSIQFVTAELTAEASKAN